MVSPYSVFELLGQPDVFGRSRIVRNFCSSFVLDRGFGNGPSGRIHRDASRFWMRLFPQSLGDFERLDVGLLPPGGLVAGLMQFAVMAAAEGNGELIAHLEANGSGLRKAQVMWVRRLTATDETRLRGHELQMRLVAQPLGLAKRERTLVDPCWTVRWW